ncbi:hypothetical protein GCM10007103_31980 [Salinimicrobium marinum]|uniref:Uncharacterized protein n=1 Tax=Salinimicrobium marinum TaxID=680283 RepID=A0A918SJN7_9FLAO|nr:hypothetical protein [Salinimicrobium marinum]GHA48643.1 hypothetical protein GCM10007103_31980 [Salinimicrobium marinum]
MEAEGGETEISFTNGDWHIAEIINKIGDTRIHGDTYSLEGGMIKENSVLSLEAKGKMAALWSDKGFVINRNTRTSLMIQLKENSTGEEFGFSVVLKSGEEVKRIEVFQKKSQGYHFESIEFSLKEEDGDSLFVKKGTTYRHNVSKSQILTVSPYGGIDVHKQSLFFKFRKGCIYLDREGLHYG